MIKIKRNFLFLAVFIVFLIGAVPVFADTSCNQPCPSGRVCLPNPLSSTCDVPSLIQNITTYISALIASLAILMFVWAGILFLSSAGNPGQIEKAKRAVLYAVIGLAIALAGKGLVDLVVNIINGGGSSFST